MSANASEYVRSRLEELQEYLKTGDLSVFFSLIPL
jgi:hypothetical protein